MAFDAGMISFVLNEINEKCAGGKIEKVYQPARDEFIFLIRKFGETHRLLINAGSRCPRVSLTEEKAENPQKAPMLCMMFRKHLQGAVFTGASQLGFERAADLVFSALDDMGYKCEKHIIVEMMGKYSNVIFTDENKKIISILRQVDFTQSMKRQLLPGMIYEAPPAQDKLDPTAVDRDAFMRLCASCDPERPCEKFIMSTFSGISPLVAREIAALAGGASDASLARCEKRLADVFFKVLRDISEHSGTPVALISKSGMPKEYCFMDINQYGGEYTKRVFSSFSELLDFFFATRSREEKISQKADDILKIVSAAQSRTEKKLALQRVELADCDEGEKYRLMGDLITANIYRLKKGIDSAVLEDYTTGDELNIKLDPRLSPAQNAQKYYKRYAKSKSAREHLTEQIEKAERELVYIATVQDALSRTDSEKELSEIRNELYHSGYASKMKQFSPKKQSAPSYLTFETAHGYTVLCGKNNTANDWLTFRHAAKNDWWFHAKGCPGSHVIMECDGREEPPAEDFTQACMIAAVYSKASASPSAEIDYTTVKQVKKPPDSKPGYVIYHTNWSASVPVDREAVKKMQK